MWEKDLGAELAFNTTGCFMLPPSPCASWLVVFWLARWWTEPFLQSSPPRNLKPTGPIQLVCGSPCCGCQQRSDVGQRSWAECPPNLPNERQRMFVEHSSTPTHQERGGIWLRFWPRRCNHPVGSPKCCRGTATRWCREIERLHTSGLSTRTK